MTTPQQLQSTQRPEATEFLRAATKQHPEEWVRAARCPKHERVSEDFIAPSSIDGIVAPDGKVWLFRCRGLTKQEARSHAKQQGLSLFEETQVGTVGGYHFFTADLPR